MNWLRRLSAWVWGIDIRAADDEAREIRRQVKIYDLAANVDELTRAIDLVAAAMPNGGGLLFDDIEIRKAMLRGIIDGRSAIIAVDWEYHPTHCVVMTTQPNGRALLTIHERSEFLQKGSQ